jgi:RecA/RadA recombinase
VSSTFFKNIVDELKDEDVSIAADGEFSAEFSGFIDTGSYVLNAVFSADIYGGVPNNKVLAFAGETSTGKTFFVMGIMKHFLDTHPDAGVIYYDTESAVTKKMMVDRGIDVERIIIGEPASVQSFRHKALTFLDRYITTPEKERPPLMMVLDSLGMLSTTKELEDTAEGKETKDMTRAGIIRATFRVLRLKLAKAKVPILVTNHTYAAIGSMYPTQEIAGGGGLKFAADQIATLSKRKEKVGDEVVGNVIHVKMWKSRLSRENKIVDVLLTYDGGLDRYYGLLDMAERYRVIKKVSTRYEMPDGSKHFGKTIYENPEKFFTKELLDAINEGVKKEFSYGAPEDTTEEEVKELRDETDGKEAD